MTTFASTRWTEAAYAKAYRDKADHFLPERRLLLSTIASFYHHFPFQHGPKRVLDLGCGDGIVGAVLCSVDTDVHLSSIDGSLEMVKAARRRLRKACVEQIEQITFQQLIGRQVDLGLFNFVVSAFAIHHLHREEKQALFCRIYEMLVDNGAFMNLDVVLPPVDAHQEWYHDLWREWIRRHQVEAGLREDLSHVPDEARNRPENHYETLEVQLDALRNAGFVEVECHYRHGLFGIYSGRKP
jgi:tRNA (cmo5U34)-methyltransferase